MVQVHVLEAEDCNVVSYFQIHLKLKINDFWHVSTKATVLQ